LGDFMLRRLFLARVPVIFLLLLAGFGPMGIATSARSLLGGLFEMDSGAGLTFVALAAILLSAGSVLAINLVRAYSDLRMNPKIQPCATADPYRAPFALFVAGMAPALILIACAWIRSGVDVGQKALGLLAGIALAVFGLIAAQWIQFRMSDPDTSEPVFLVFDASEVPILGPALNRAFSQRPSWFLENFVRRPFAKLESLIALAGPRITQGYLYRSEPRLFVGHIFAAALALIGILIWLGIGLAKQYTVGAPEVWWFPPALAYVVLAMLVFMWVLSGLAFFLDRYRVPLLLAVILYTGLVGKAKVSDHFYRTAPHTGAPVVYAPPSEILASRTGVPVVIATAGGGIQAAAWTTRVVNGLKQELGGDPLPRVALISSVSGGSLGSFYLGAALSHKIKGLDDAEWVSTLNSLDDVAWGLVNPDIWRTVQPWIRDPDVDRAWALERSWEERSGMHETYLVDWAAQAGKQLPAFVFNATMIERGAALAFGTSDFPSEANVQAKLRRVQDFRRLYNNQVKVRVSTAARLSASFPYVAPASRSDFDTSRPDFHVVDGGYYDNFGLLSAMDWLNQAFYERPNRFHRVAIVAIRSFADGSGEAQGSLEGWNYQVYAPLQGVLQVRSNQQLAEDQAKLRIFEDHWRLRGVEIQHFDIVYPAFPDGSPCNDPPLSWKMNRVQKHCLVEGWQRPIRSGSSRAL
jgi:hypothetical protein